MNAHIQDIPLCKGLPQAAIDELTQKGELRHFTTGTPLFLEGQKSQGVHFVLSGIVKVIRTTSKGQERILYLARTGNMVGEDACLQGMNETACTQLSNKNIPLQSKHHNMNTVGTHPASALATSPVDTLFISCINLQHCLEKYPALALRMLKALATRQRMFIHKVAAQAERSAIRRVAAYILHRSFMEEQNDTISLGVAREDFANLLGHARETTSRQLSTLVDMKAIEYIGQSGRIIRILDRDTLQGIVDEGFE